MSLVVEKFLLCDECGRTYGVDMRQVTACVHRASAKKEGWVKRGYKDFCPDCKQKAV